MAWPQDLCLARHSLSCSERHRKCQSSALGVGTTAQASSTAFHFKDPVWGPQPLQGKATAGATSPVSWRLLPRDCCQAQVPLPLTCGAQAGGTGISEVECPVGRWGLSQPEHLWPRERTQRALLFL